jgi:hypothetical protein
VNFDRESWRKLYVRESAEDRLLPLLCRGLRDYLLRHAKDDGTILTRTEDPAGDLARALTAHSHEAKPVQGFVRMLLDTGFLSHVSGRLWITNFADAQAARSAGARRQKKYRDAQQTPKQETSDAPVTPTAVTDNVTSDARATSQREETRRDERSPTPSEPSEPKEPRPDPFGDTLRKSPPGRRLDVLRVWERFKTALAYPPKTKFRSDWDDDAKRIAERIDAYDEATCLAVVDAAPLDGMVSGRTDEFSQKHDTVAYVFENQNTFNRLLRAAEKSKAAPAPSASDAMRKARRA